MADYTRDEVLQVVAISKKLQGSDLSRLDLSEANLSKADLSKADLIGADLSGAHLEGAKYSASNTRWPYGFRPDATGAVLG